MKILSVLSTREVADMAMTPQQPAPAKCDECGGKGYVYEGEAITGRGPEDVFPEKAACPECQPAPEGVSDADIMSTVAALETVRNDLFSLSRPAVSAIQGKAIYLIERMEAELKQRRSGQEWRTIESAPRDGRELLLSQGSDVAICYAHQDKRLRDGIEWRISNADRYVFRAPTHWMPLPPAPAAEKATNQDSPT